MTEKTVFLPPPYNHKGFTLAETLITLVIIGIVAALTVPAMINNYTKEDMVARLKKTNSTLQNAVSIISNKHGYPPGDYSVFSSKSFIDEFAEISNVTKKCATLSECLNSDISYKTMNNDNFNYFNNKSIITSDGQIYTFAFSSGGYGLSSTDQANQIGVITVDLNGPKKPNKVGYDVFMFMIVRNKGILPAGAYSKSTCSKTSNGYGCCSKVLKEGKITYW